MTFPYDANGINYRLRAMYRRHREMHPPLQLDRGYVAYLDKRLERMIARDLHKTGLITGTPNQY